MDSQLSSFVGYWRITDMEVWDADARDMAVPAYIEIDPDGGGKFQFCMVEGFLDCRAVVRDGKPALEFSWEGFDEMDRANGRGWAILIDDNSLKGRIFIQQADDSSFHAVRQQEPKKKKYRR